MRKKKRGGRRASLGLVLLSAFMEALCPVQGLAKTSVVDHSGRRIVLERPFRRIISLYGAHTVNLLHLGAQSCLVGVSREGRRIPKLSGKRVFTYHDGPERFLAVRPDLLLIRPMIDRGYPGLIRKLEQTGVTVASLQPRSLDQMYAYWRVLGKLTGREAEAEAMVRGFKDALERISKTVATIPVTERKRVYFEAIHSKMKTFSPTSITMFCLQAAGGINVASEAVAVRDTNIAWYGKERILAKAHQIDVYLAQVGPMNRVTAERIRREAGFQAVKAVREGRIFTVEERWVSRPTPELLRGILSIAGLLYPTYFSGVTDGVEGHPEFSSGKGAGP